MPYNNPKKNQGKLFEALGKDRSAWEKLSDAFKPTTARAGATELSAEESKRRADAAKKAAGLR